MNRFKFTIDEINPDGRIVKKVFRHCLSKEDFIETIEFLARKNELAAIGYKDIKLPKNGLIVFLHITLMQFGKIDFVEFSEKNIID